jgi:hypothetical protein
VSENPLQALPDKPNIEFEKKRAKKLVKQNPEALTLARAQLQIARGYGFASWPKLTAYFATWNAHHRAGYRGLTQTQLELDNSVALLLHEFAQRHALVEQPADVLGTGAALAAYVPRFYGLSDSEIFASTLSEADAQLVVARRNQFPDWNAACLAVSHAEGNATSEAAAIEAKRAAQQAVRNRDAAQIDSLFRENPDWIVAPDSRQPLRGLAWEIIRLAARAQDGDTRRLVDSLHNVGVDVQGYLDVALLGSLIPRMTAIETRGLLALGANPLWNPANGYSVLEHAILRYGDGEAVDVIAALCKHPQTFWGAAGVGDVKTMLRYIDARGEPNEAARANRPDPALLGTGGSIRPGADAAEVLWEAFVIATLNTRIPAMRAMLDRGFPIDYTPVWYNALHVAVSYRLETAVAFLIDNGANLDFKAGTDQLSPRELAVNQARHSAADVQAQRILALIAAGANGSRSHQDGES